MTENSKTRTFTLTEEQIETLVDELDYGIERLSDERENCDIDEVEELDERIKAVKALLRLF